MDDIDELLEDIDKVLDEVDLDDLEDMVEDILSQPTSGHIPEYEPSQLEIQQALDGPLGVISDREGIAIKKCPICGFGAPVAKKYCNYCGYNFREKNDINKRINWVETNPPISSIPSNISMPPYYYNAAADPTRAQPSAATIASAAEHAALLASVGNPKVQSHQLPLRK